MRTLMEMNYPDGKNLVMRFVQIAILGEENCMGLGCEWSDLWLSYLDEVYQMVVFVG